MTTVDTYASGKTRRRGRIAQKIKDWREEFPATISGLWQATKPLRWAALGIVLFNIVLTALDTAQPWVLATGVNALFANAPYREALFAIVLPMLMVKFPFTIILPTIREIFTVLCFRPKLEKHLSFLCLPSATSSRLDGGPAALMGRNVAMPLVDSLLRDPWYLLRGIGLVLWLLYLSPVLGVCIILGMALDLYITLHIDAWLDPGFTRQQRFQRGISKMENDIHAGARDVRAALPLFNAAWDTRNCVFAWTQVKALIAQNILREGTANIVRLALMALVGYWVSQKYVPAADYIVFVSLVDRTNDPLNTFLNLQNAIMQNREALRRLQEMSGIPFLRRKQA